MKAVGASTAASQLQFTQLSRANAVTGVLRASRDISRFTGQTTENLARAVPQAATLSRALGAVTMGGAVDGLAGLIKQSAEWGNQLKKLSATAGVNPTARRSRRGCGR
jgi:hypothetical protein